MTHKLRSVIAVAMLSLREIRDILDSGDPSAVGEVNEQEVEMLLDLSSLASDVAMNADLVYDEGHELAAE